MSTRTAVTMFVALFFMLAMSLFAIGEHPSAPQQPQFKLSSQTTTGKPESATQTMVVSDAEISAGIKKYIYAYAKKSTDKKFHVRSDGKDVALDLIAIHDDQRSHLGGDKYFACVDMKAANGTIYDIDFFMVLRPGRLSVTESSVHKINGKPLYSWKEENGVWKKARVP